MASSTDKPRNPSKVKRVIAVLSGKGGVGKSMVTSILATSLMRQGNKVGILDADITGPSIPKTFGLAGQRCCGMDGLFVPAQTQTGIKIMSSNLMLEHDTDPVLWRGPVVASAIKQFWEQTLWGDIDYLLVDMPPGTGDVALTVFQSLPVDGIVIVTSPQDLVSMIVAKAVNMANKMNIPILGVVENMSYAICPDCGKHLHLFGESKLEEVAKSYNVAVLDRMAIDPTLAQLCDKGTFETDVADDLLVHALKACNAVEAHATEDSLYNLTCIAQGGCAHCAHAGTCSSAQANN